jgi:hypothetical protein
MPRGRLWNALGLDLLRYLRGSGMLQPSPDETAYVYTIIIFAGWKAHELAHQIR